MSDLRDIIIHAYFGVDEEIVWDVVAHHVPILHQQRMMITELPNLGDDQAFG